MKKIILASMLFTYASANAQDVLITQNGDVMNVYDVEVGHNTVFYKNENTSNAPTLRISKNDVFMIKRKDGTKLDLGNGMVGNEEATVGNGANSIHNQVGATAATTSADSQKRNAEIINQVNTFNPEYVGNDTNKACARVMCIMGLNEDSQLVNDEIEITPILGIVSPGHGKNAIKKAVNSEGKVIDGSKAKFQENTVVDQTFGYMYSNPAFQIKVKNKTNRTLYVDLGNTFFIRNDVATAYYVPSSTSSSSQSSLGASVNLGAVAGALGVGGTLGTLAGGIGVGGGTTSGTVNTTYSQRIIAIPPMSTKNLDAQLLFLIEGSEICEGLSSTIYENSVIPYFIFSKKENRKYMNGETHDFSQPTSPINFRFHVAYADNEACQNERNMSFGFYLRRMIGFGIKNLKDYRNNANKLPEVIPDFGKCTYFVGFVGKASDNGFPRGDK